MLIGLPRGMTVEFLKQTSLSQMSWSSTLTFLFPLNYNLKIKKKLWVNGLTGLFINLTLPHIRDFIFKLQDGFERLQLGFRFRITPPPGDEKEEKTQGAQGESPSKPCSSTSWLMIPREKKRTWCFHGRRQHQDHHPIQRLCSSIQDHHVFPLPGTH